MNKTSALEYLMQHGVKPSVQRLAVMEYLLDHRTHPSAEEIHTALVTKIPTLSKTTVYNTLKLFVENGAAIMLTIDERNANFDADTSAHAHFLCRKCGRIYDLPLDGLKLAECTQLPEGFAADEMTLYARGVCRACQSS